ncbi:translation release factor [Aureococcus anophagefferens]|nr:translation release factor [Aureococcus anophagefferens]
MVARRARRRVSAAALRALAAKRGRYDELCAVASAEEAWEGCVAELDSLAELEDELRGGDAVGDAELRDEARRERELLAPKVETLAHDLTAKLLPRDAVDDAPACLVEVKAAAGGDEASLFAGDFLAMYERFAGRRRHGWDLLSVTKSDCGGVSHAYAEVNTTNSAVRVTHLPTNTVVSIQDERSQHRNKAKALKVLASRVVGAQAAAAPARSASRWRGQRRPPAHRTYNAPHDRVTDHRSGFTANSVDRVLRGDLPTASRPEAADATHGRVRGEQRVIFFYFGLLSEAQRAPCSFAQAGEGWPGACQWWGPA